MARARGLVSALPGALAGIAAAGAIVASAPVAGGEGVPTVVGGGDAGQWPGATATAVSAVIAPAPEAGVDQASRSEANRP